MPVGRPPDTREQRIAKGNPSKRPLPEPVGFPGHFVTPEDVATPPAGLGETAKRWWRDVVPVLQSLGLLEKIDFAMLEFAATQYQRAVQARRVIDKEGVSARGSKGQPREHPLLETERKAQTQYLRFIEQFAGTPLGRVRLGIAELQRRSLAEELESGLGKPKLVEVGANEEIVEGTAKVVG